MKKSVFLVALSVTVILMASSCSGASGGSNDAGSLDLSSLSVNVGTLVPAFDPDETEYTVSVANSDAQITVTAVTADFYAGTWTSGNVADGDTTDCEWTYALVAGTPKDIVITVTAADFSPSSKSYTITVTRASL